MRVQREPGHTPGLRAVWAGRMLALAALAAIAAATLTPEPVAAAATRAPGFLGGEMEVQDFVANVLLFAPFGVGIGLASARTRWAVLIALIVSTGIELTQEFFIPGRYAAIADVTANVLGGTIGGWVGAHAPMLARPSRRDAAWLAGAGSVVAAIVFGFTAWLIEPGSPSVRYEGQYSSHWWVPRGTVPGVVWATFNGSPIEWRPFPLASSADINRALGAGTLRLDGRVVPGAPFDGRGRLLTVIEHERPDHLALVALFAEHRDLVFSARTRADRWHLRSPWVRVRNVFPAGASDQSRTAPDDWAARLVAYRDTIAIGGERDGRTMRVWARGATGHAERSVTLTPAIGWMLFTPVGATPRGGETLFSILWVLGVAGAPLYWLLVAIGGMRMERN